MNKVKNLYSCYFRYGIKGLNKEIFDISEDEEVEWVEPTYKGRYYTAQEAIDRLVRGAPVV